MNRHSAPTACLLLAALLFAAGPAPAETRVVDAEGKPVIIPNNKRVVSIGGSVSETIHALGLSDRVIAVDTTSSYPRAYRHKPNVGYMRRLATEPILALEPSLVLAVEDSGPPAVLAQLREAGLPVVMVPDIPSPLGVLEKVTLVAEAMGAEENGEALKAKLKTEMATVQKAITKATSRPRVLFLLSVGGGGAPLAAGRETSAAGIIELAGGTNAIDAFEGYKPLSPEATVEAAPDVLLVTKRSLGLLGGAHKLLTLPEIAATPAGENRVVVAMDGLLLLGFGPRTGAAIQQLAEKLHPGLFPPAAAE